MAGLAIYEIAPAEDRVEELLECVAKATKTPVADLLEAFKAQSEAKDFVGIVREILENHQQAFKSGSDDGACGASRRRL